MKRCDKMSIYDEALELHKKLNGKLEVVSKRKLNTKKDLSLLYTPGVAEASNRIYKNNEMLNQLTMRNNFVAIISDGSAVLGLGNIGPKAAMPVMEGKALLFKEFANVNAIPLCIDTQNVDKIVEFTKLISPTFGGINFEDISSPRCFEIEEKLKNNIKIPIFHDDQHGTAIVVGAALINALKIVNKKIEKVKIVINGIGAAGTAIAKFIISLGAKNIILVDKNGILNPEDKHTIFHKYHKELAELTNNKKISGDLKLALKNSDVFIGVSKGKIVTEDMIKSMNKDAIVIAMANPKPEILPDIAKEAGARIVCTGRSDYPNQVNNVLAFPGVFRGTLDVEAKEINEEMKKAAAFALAKIVDNELNENNILPNPLDKRIVREVAFSVASAAIASGVAKKNIEKEKLKEIIKFKLQRVDENV